MKRKRVGIEKTTALVNCNGLIDNVGVEVFGLQSNTQYNGVKGTLNGYNTTTNR